jgi:hypothetical protein
LKSPKNHPAASYWTGLLRFTSTLLLKLFLKFFQFWFFLWQQKNIV